ncbi:hypothetical protein JTB14_024081 [Gonioctena quinquepunctata]|nr:hypothetical protein JTB14_024081 [Gonioctena quinquepunctata]
MSLLLWNLFTSDMPATNSQKFCYADDIAIATQSGLLEDGEVTLTADLENLGRYYKQWRLCPNPRGLTLHELLQSLEDSDDDGHNGLALTMLPPTNACEPVTDEDSCDEDYVNINNLPGSQLRAEAEIFYGDSEVTNRTNIPKTISVTDNNLDGTDSEDNIPLMELRGRLKKKKIEVKKKSYKWVAKDLIPEEVQFPCQQNVLNNNSASELF